MSKMFLSVCMAASLAYAAPVSAQSTLNDLPPELQGFGLDENILPIGSDNESGLPSVSHSSGRQTIIPYIMSTLPKATADTATSNIINAEQVFCYHVAANTPDSNNYTLNNFAIVDYCGELDRGTTATTYEALFTQSPNIITARSDCRIEPRVMLRFVRGVDYTDVLLSSPCPSFTVFYAGRYTAFNIKQGVIDDIISQFDQTHETFNSPSLLKKTVANGVAETVQETEAYEKKQKENAPLMKWKMPGTDESGAAEKSGSSSSSGKPATGGWGNIKLRM